MPLMTIRTNVSKDKITADFLKRLSLMFETEFQKPKQFVFVNVMADQPMLFGESPDPCAVVEIISIGKLGVEENKEHTRVIMEMLEKELGLSPERTFVLYIEPKSSDVGYNKTTFHGLV